MAKKAAPSVTVTKKPEVTATPIRNTAIPKSAKPAAAKVVAHHEISARAYEISQSPTCSSEFDNWLRAERELKGL